MDLELKLSTEKFKGEVDASIGLHRGSSQISDAIRQKFQKKNGHQDFARAKENSHVEIGPWALP